MEKPGKSETLHGSSSLQLTSPAPRNSLNESDNPSSVSSGLTWIAYDAEDCGFQRLNDDEIVISMQEESDPVDDETDEDEDNNNAESSKCPSNADAFSVSETPIEGYGKQSECYPTQLLLLKRIRDLVQ
ncbi:hypothetical protein TNCV_1403851 [Trichonephila clavipes]|nr:hypothetical protein TNCV_1403851 [Trichonephila clavipes]